jgi:creatinine amidohydrolase
MLRIATVLLLLPVFSTTARAQSLPIRWEELTSPDFVRAIEQARGTCILPLGSVEKHGPHAPLGTDLFNIRYTALEAAKREYAVVFPEFYASEMSEAAHEPGTVFYSPRLMWILLEETTQEMARNGCSRVVLANGHGGNNFMLQYFAQSRAAVAKDHVVYLWSGFGGPTPAGRPPVHSQVDSHAGEAETAAVLFTRPELVHLDRAADETGANQNRAPLPPGLYTGIRWYSMYPNQYAGIAAAQATRELGEFDTNARIAALVSAIRAVKADEASLVVQREYQAKSLSQ